MKREFYPGSEWVYLKVYTGIKCSERILEEILSPLQEKWLEEGCINGWFFIRYGDPDYHLRIRILTKDTLYLSKIIREFHNQLLEYLDNDLIWKIQLDTYKREISRYGDQTIEDSERLFFVDSWCFSEFLKRTNVESRDHIRWLFGLKSIDQFLHAFNYDLHQKLEILDHLRNYYGKEFNMSRPLKKQMDHKYRRLREDLVCFLKSKNSQYQYLYKLLEDRDLKIFPITKVINTKLSADMSINKKSFLASHLHMIMNRLFPSKSRLNEMVAYDYLYRYYHSEIAKQKYAHLKSISA